MTTDVTLVAALCDVICCCCFNCSPVHANFRGGWRQQAVCFSETACALPCRHDQGGVHAEVADADAPVLDSHHRRRDRLQPAGAPLPLPSSFAWPWPNFSHFRQTTMDWPATFQCTSLSQQPCRHLVYFPRCTTRNENGAQRRSARARMSPKDSGCIPACTVQTCSLLRPVHW